MTSYYSNLILLFSTLLILIIPSFQTQFLSLTHSLSTTKFTSQHHLLKTTTTMSSTRHNYRKNKQLKHQNQQVSLPLSPGSDYTLTFTINSQTLSVYMDTGSDIVWFPCSPFECILCEGKIPSAGLNLLNLSNPSVSAVSCQTTACSTSHSSISTSDLCAMAKCPLEDIETSDCSKFACPPFYYAYGDGSFVARLHKNDLIMPSNNKNKNLLVLKDFKFGCANTALAEPIGVAGFGRGLLSLPAQLADISPELGSQFSYCLVSHSFNSTKLRHPSPLILGKHKYKVGDDLEIMSSFVYTPLLDNPKHPYFYSVGLDAISLGSRRIDSPKRLKRVDSRGDGGVVVDSGTTYTMMPTGFYNSVANELDRRVGKVFTRDRVTESKVGLSPCYDLDSKKGSVGLVVPSMVLHFSGNSSVRLPRENYFYEFMNGGDGLTKGQKVGCFMMMDGGDDGSEIGPGLTLGNYQQQGFEVVYDLEEKRVGFARRKCASLWENLNQN